MVFTSMSVLLGSLSIFSVFLALLSHLIYGTTAARFRPFLMMSAASTEASAGPASSTGPMMRIELISAVDRRDRATSTTSRRPHRAYRPALAGLGQPVEFIYVIDGPMPRAMQALRALKAAGEPIEILSFATPFGEAAALTVGFRHAAGDVVFTLTPEIAGGAGDAAAAAGGAGRQ